MWKFFGMLFTMPVRHIFLIFIIIGIHNSCRHDIPEIDKYIYDGEITDLIIKNYKDKGGAKKTLYIFTYVDGYGNVFDDEVDTYYNDDSFIVKGIKEHKLYHKNDTYSFGPYFAIALFLFLFQLMIFICIMYEDISPFGEFMFMLTPFYLLSNPYENIFVSLKDFDISGILKKFFGYE